MKGSAIAAAVAARAPMPGLRTRLQLPLYRNGYALVVGSGLTSALGLVYWVVAARTYSLAAVGVSAALISAMTLLANLAQVNLKSALNRFLPTAGSRTARFVMRSYAVALVASAVASVIFLAGLDIWSPRLGFLSERPELALWFIASTMAWTIFVLQDSVLAGIRQAGWVPVENLLYALTKIGLLVALAALAPTLGTFVAWTAPLLALVVPLNLLLFRRLIPRHVRATRGQEQTLAGRQIARYVTGDYVAYLILTATIGVLPLIVLGVVGPEASAYYFVSWSMSYALYLIAGGMGVSMIAEASLDPSLLRAHCRRTMLETARLTVPAVAVVVVAAPYILGLLGEQYSRESVVLLRLLALSALPWIIFVAYTNVARVQRRMRAVIGANVALSGLVLILGIPLLATIGIEGLGVAWLAAQSAVATAIIAGQLRPTARRRWPTHALLALSSARIWGVHVWRIVGGARARRTVVDDLRRSDPERSQWRLQRHLRTRNDVAVSMIGAPRAAPSALVKLATSEAAERSLRLQHDTVLRLRGIPGLERWTGIVPQVLAGGVAEGRRFVVEKCLPGTAGDRLLRDPESHEQLLIAAETAIAPLHEATRRVTRVDDELLRDWVDLPLARLRSVIARRSRLSEAAMAVECLRAELHEVLGDRRVATSQIHGDLCPSNLLMSSDARAVLGIVDWEQGCERGLAQLDLLHLLMTARMQVERCELGAVVVQMLRDPRWRPEELPVARVVAQGEPSPKAQTRTIVLLTWLHHISANLGKSTRYGRSRAWVRWNIDPVLAQILGESALSRRQLGHRHCADGS
ncbi:MAG TPA: phosphotransferase [Solirubrobacteraceae bacterium]